MKNKQSSKQKNLHRIKIIGGHIRAIEEMLGEGKYCVDIIHQSLAVQKALKRLDMALIKDHLHTCVVDQIRRGETDRSIDELLRLYEMK